MTESPSVKPQVEAADAVVGADRILLRAEAVRQLRVQAIEVALRARAPASGQFR
jgi:hypothetical protein